MKSFEDVFRVNSSEKEIILAVYNNKVDSRRSEIQHISSF